MNETLETNNQAPSTPPKQPGDQLGNFLIGFGVLAAFLMCAGLVIGLWQGGDDEEPNRRDAERQFVDDRDDREDVEERDRRLEEECNIDRSDAEERFAPECDEWEREREERRRNDRDGEPGLFPDE